MKKIVKTSKGNAIIFYDPRVTPKDKKYSVITPSDRLIHFGARDYEQYKDQALGLYRSLNHNDKKRRYLFRKRHAKDYYDDPEYPSYYSWWYLW